MTPDEALDLSKLVGSAKAFLRIDRLEPFMWTRPTKNNRKGPWKDNAIFTELDRATWDQVGEVLYFVVDDKDQMRMVGQTVSDLSRRWNLSPMCDVEGTPLGRKGC